VLIGSSISIPPNPHEDYEGSFDADGFYPLSANRCLTVYLSNDRRIISCSTKDYNLMPEKFDFPSFPFPVFQEILFCLANNNVQNSFFNRFRYILFPTFRHTASTFFFGKIFATRCSVGKTKIL